MIDWTIFAERIEFHRAKENRLHRKQLQNYFSVIGNYRNSIYHHVGDGGATAAVRRIKKIIDVPKGYTRFLGPQVPIINTKEAAREIAKQIYSEMPASLRNGTSIEFLRYLAKRYPVDIMRKGLEAKEKTIHYKIKCTEFCQKEVNQYRPAGLKSLYATNLENVVRSEKEFIWVWWP